jgi:hypothetical protein
MAWEIIVTEEFKSWWLGLDEAQSAAVFDRVGMLEEHGPVLKRPLVGEVVTSRHQNMKELRVSKDGALRILFAFDPLRRAILLIGGNKAEGSQWSDWYPTAVRLADELYDAHLQEVAEEYPDI